MDLKVPNDDDDDDDDDDENDGHDDDKDNDDDVDDEDYTCWLSVLNNLRDQNLLFTPLDQDGQHFPSLFFMGLSHSQQS